MPYSPIAVRNINCLAYNATFGADGNLWFSTLGEDGVLSVDLATLEVLTRFSHHEFCKFAFDGSWGALGTVDGRLFVFSVHEPTLRFLAAAETCASVDAIAIDGCSKSIFFVSDCMVLRVAMDGTLLGKWSCHMETFCTCFVPTTSCLWLACDGIEILNIKSGNSLVKRQGMGFPYYVHILPSPNGYVACFRGDIDIIDYDGEQIDSIPGDYNRGIFDPSGRLLAREVTQAYPDDVSIYTRRTMTMEYDVISPCDSYAMNSTGQLVVASHRGKLFLFSKQ